MRSKGLLAAFLLGVGLCFVPVLGYGEVQEWMLKSEASYVDYKLLEARVDYMMGNPTRFLHVTFYYDPTGVFGRKFFPKGIDTKGKIVIRVADNRGVFSYMSGIALLDQFKKELKVIYSFLDLLATDIETDIVAKFQGGGAIPLGYFYQGEYYLWETSRAKGATKEEVTPPVSFLFENVTVWEISRLRSGAVLGTRLTGEIVNQSGITYNRAWFRVTLYGAAGKVLGWREFALFDVRDGERIRFKVFFYDVDSSDVWDWKIEFDRGL